MILILLYLPGHFLGGPLARKGDGWAELVLLRIAAAAAVSGPVLVILALAGWFTLPAIVGSLLACGAAGWTVAHLLGGGARGIPTRFSGWDLGALGLVAGAFALYARPAEYFINRADPGAYVLGAAKLARLGELLTRDPLVAAVSPFHSFSVGEGRWQKYPGFDIHGIDLIVPRFFPGTFAWQGLSNLVGGDQASLYVVPIFGALAVGLAFVLGRELFGRWAGLIGAALLAINYTQVWWARQPSSEVITQFFILGGLWLGARFIRGAGPGTGILTGALFGGAMLVRVDAFIALAALPLLLGHGFLTRRSMSRWAAPLAILALFGGAMALYIGTIDSYYLRVIYEKHGLARALELAPYAAAAALLVVGATIVARQRWGGRIETLLEVRGRYIALTAALLVAGVALWAYFVLPVPWEDLPEPPDPEDFNAYRSQVLVRMLWFLTPAVGVLALAGFVLAAYRPSAARFLLLGAVLAFGLLVAAVPNVAPDLPWTTRRFVSVIFPGLCLLAGYAAVEAGRFLGRAWSPRAGVALAGALAAVAFVWTAWITLPIVGVRQYEGLADALDRLDKEIPAAQVVFYQRDPFPAYAAPLEILYGRPVIPYDREQFREEVEELREAGLLKDAVYVTAYKKEGENQQEPSASGLEFHQVGTSELVVPELFPTYQEVPRESGQGRHDVFRVYEVEER